jgi:hypothetical protein
MQSLCIGTRDVLLSDALTRPVNLATTLLRKHAWFCMQGDSLRNEEKVHRATRGRWQTRHGRAGGRELRLHSR